MSWDGKVAAKEPKMWDQNCSQDGKERKLPKRVTNNWIEVPEYWSTPKTEKKGKITRL